VYSGEFCQNQPHGHGCFQYLSGNEYDGQWINGKREGNGVFKYSNGDEYAGEWRSDKKDGIGIYRWANGDLDMKTYSNDRPNEGVRWNADQSLCWQLVEGEVVDSMPLNEAETIRENFCMASPFLSYFLF